MPAAWRQHWLTQYFAVVCSLYGYFCSRVMTLLFRSLARLIPVQRQINVALAKQGMKKL